MIEESVSIKIHQPVDRDGWEVLVMKHSKEGGHYLNEKGEWIPYQDYEVLPTHSVLPYAYAYKTGGRYRA